MSVRLPQKTAAGVLFTLLLMIFGFNVRAADQDPVPRFFYEVEVNSLTEPSDSAADELSVLTPEEESLKAAYEEASAPDAPDGSVFLGAAEDGGQARFSNVKKAAESVLCQFRERADRIELELCMDISSEPELYSGFLDAETAYEEGISALKKDKSLSDEEREQCTEDLKEDRDLQKFRLLRVFLWRKAFTHNAADPTGGDYSAYLYGAYGVGYKGTLDGTVCSGLLYYRMYSVDSEGNKLKDYYYTTAAQEAELSGRLSGLMQELFGAGASEASYDAFSEYERATAIYDYICGNVSYDYSHDSEYTLNRSAYGALIEGKALCQGYSVLFYRMALMSGLDARIISGYSGGNHAWNLVRLGDLYYLADTTWDAGTAPGYYWCLKGSEDFPNHTPNHSNERVEIDGFLTGARPNIFTPEDYPVDPKNYTESYFVTYSGIETDERYTLSYTALSPLVRFPAPDLSGFSFSGWYLDSSFSRKAPAQYDETLGLYSLDLSDSRENLTLYPKFQANKLKISYLSAPGAKASFEQSFSIGVPQALKTNSFKYSGQEKKRFRCWQAAAPYEEYTFEEGETVTFYTGNEAAEASDGIALRVDEGNSPVSMELYPVWDLSFSVKLILEEGMSIPEPGDFSQTEGGLEFKAEGVSGKKLALPKNVTKPGYRFLGWVKAGSEKVISSVSNADVTLYPSFRPYTLTLKFSLNKPSGSRLTAQTPANLTLYGDSSLILPELSASGTHSFKGWSETKSGGGLLSSGAVFAPAAPLTSNQTKTLYAVWEAKSYQISFLLMDSGEAMKNAEGEAIVKECPCGKALNLSKLTPADLGYEARTDSAIYRFLGWYMETGGKLKKLTSIASANTTDLTLYACYDISYRLILHRDSESKSFTGCRTGAAKALPSLRSLGWAPTSNQVFAGWSLGDAPILYTDGGRISFLKDPSDRKYSALFSGNEPTLELYAVYQKKPTAEEPISAAIRYYLDGELYATSTRSINGKTTIKLDTLKRQNTSGTVLSASPRKTGYSFTGWKDVMTGKKITSVSGKDYRPVIELEALFTPKKLNVFYRNNYETLPSGTKGKPVTAKFTATYETAQQALKSCGFKFTGFSFAGWSLTPSGSVITDADGKVTDRDAVISGIGNMSALTLYAIWVPVSYTYHYDDYGTASFSASETKTLEGHSAGFRIPPAREGYRFAGWAKYRTDSRGRLYLDQKGRPVKTKTRFTAPAASELYLYGLWEAVE